MNMISAKEARDISNSYRYKDIFQLIKENASKGRMSCKINILSTKDTEELTRMGYNVSGFGTGVYTISWENA